MAAGFGISVANVCPANKSGSTHYLLRTSFENTLDPVSQESYDGCKARLADAKNSSGLAYTFPTFVAGYYYVCNN